jgi:hypothetical protein
MLSTVGTYTLEVGQAEDTQEFYKTNKNDFLCVVGFMNAIGMGRNQ